GSGIEFDGLVSNNALLAVAGNNQVGGLLSGIEFNTPVVDSTVVIAGNTTIFGLDAIVFGQPLILSQVTIGPATVTVDGVPTAFGDNTTILGLDDGINVDQIFGGSFTVVGNTTIRGVVGSGIEFDDAISNSAVVSVNDNTEIRGGEEGVEFDTTVTDSTVTIAGNQNITGDTTAGIQFGDLVDNSIVTIGGPTAADGNNIFGNLAGIELITGFTGAQPMTIQNNTIQVTSLAGTGIVLNNLDSSAPVSIIDDSINGGAFGIQVRQLAGTGLVGQVILDGVTVNNATDTGLEFFSNNALDTLEVTFQNAVTINGGASPADNGLVFDGLGLSIAGNTLADTRFVGTGGNFVELQNGALFEPGQPTLIDGSGVFWNGLNPAIVGERAQIIAKIVDFLDDPTLGLIFPGAGLGDEQTYDRFTRYDDYFRTVGDLIQPNTGTIRYPGGTISISEELEQE
ncbi:MAG: hypothetical protein MI861_13550, partial [Pirellulales bacterium]|nr:hypothetical protein [Pirellulales bacterium]